MTSSHELYDEVKHFKNILVSFSTGGEGNSDEYLKTRIELLNEASIKDKLPSFIRNCRNLGEFWQFIKLKFPTYQERRLFLKEQFEPVQTYLEELLNHVPVDYSASQVLICIDSVHVQEAWTKAVERRSNDPEGAITAARTLIETVCKFILDETGEPYDINDDLPDLYKKVAQQLNLSPSQHEEQIFKQILGGVNSVVTGLGSLRNKLGDAHGKGKVGIKPSPRHAQLAVNLAGSVATFLIETWEVRAVK